MFHTTYPRSMIVAQHRQPPAMTQTARTTHLVLNSRSAAPTSAVPHHKPASAEFQLARPVSGVLSLEFAALTFPRDFDTVHAAYGNDRIMFAKRVRGGAAAGDITRRFDVAVPPGQYRSVADLVRALNASIAACADDVIPVVFLVSEDADDGFVSVRVQETDSTVEWGIGANVRFAGLADMLGFVPPSGFALPSADTALDDALFFLPLSVFADTTATTGTTGTTGGGNAFSGIAIVPPLPVVTLAEYSGRAPRRAQLTTFSDLVVHVRDFLPDPPGGGSGAFQLENDALRTVLATHWSTSSSSATSEDVTSGTHALALCAGTEWAASQPYTQIAVTSASLNVLTTRRQFPTLPQQYNNSSLLQRIRIDITNEFGQCVRLPANAHFRVVLRATSLL